jgi:hypothetical protein
MFRAGEVIGCLLLNKTEPFTDGQISLPGRSPTRCHANEKRGC